LQCPSGMKARSEWDGHMPGGFATAVDCCYPQCHAAGWRDNGDTSGTFECSVGKEARDEDDGAWCAGSCDESECCSSTCWNAGYRDHGDESSTFQCSSELPFARESHDGHRCSSNDGACDESECCGESCASIDSASCPDGQQSRGSDSLCTGSMCSTSQCCFVGCAAWADAGNTCPGEDSILSTTDGCDNNAISGCNEERCCKNALEEQCRTEAAQDCSSCAMYGPCLSSIDPKCISQDALDCLPCEAEDVIHCATCAPHFDNNCISTGYYDGFGCVTEDLEYTIPTRISECFLTPPFASEGYTYLNAADLVYNGKCEDAMCTSCEDEDTFTQVFIDEYTDQVKSGECINEDEDEPYSRQASGLIDSTMPGNPCPDAGPCGPASCVIGVDEKCIVFTVFSTTSMCSVVDDALQYDSAGDYHAFAIGDDACRQDGSGRSYYKLTIDFETEMGTGLVGCSDEACSTGCTELSMHRGECLSPDWAHGLQLTANAVVKDWELAGP